MIDKLTDQKKSVMLARAMGWEVVDHEYLEIIDGPSPFERPISWQSFMPPDGELRECPLCSGGYTTLYDPANMALAWRVLNWAIVSPWNNVIGYTFTGNVAILRMFEDAKMIKLSPADAQRAWLDKVLSLEIEAGLIQEIE